MKSSYLTNLLLLVLAVLLLWFITEPQTSPTSLTISNTLTATQVNQIKIHRQEQQTIQLQQQQQWQLIHPVKARANQTRIKLLLSLLEQPVQEPLPVTDETNLAEFGLEQPSLIVSFNQHRFAFGAIESLSGYRYILHNQQLYLINDDISPLLSASASSFIDNRLLDTESRIQTLHLPQLLNKSAEQHSAELSIYQQNTGWYSIPENYTQDKLLTFLQNWQQAYAMQVVIMSEGVTSQDTPVVLIKLTDDTQRKFSVTYSGEGLTLTDPQRQLQYQFPAAMTDALFSISH